MQFVHKEIRSVEYTNKDELEVYIHQGLFLEIHPDHTRKIALLLSPMRECRDLLIDKITRATQKEVKDVCCMRPSLTMTFIDREKVQILEDTIKMIESVIGRLEHAMHLLRKRSLKNRLKLEKKTKSKLQLTRVFVRFSATAPFLT